MSKHHTTAKKRLSICTKIFRAILGFGLLFFTTLSIADGLKVFGPEFCEPYSAGTCINFHYKDLKDAKNLLGDYKYPKGRKAYDECAKNSDSTDGSLAYCSMVFHREEQSPKKRAEMCGNSVRDSYYRVASGNYAMSSYDSVWGCR